MIVENKCIADPFEMLKYVSPESLPTTSNWNAISAFIICGVCMNTVVERSCLSVCLRTRWKRSLIKPQTEQTIRWREANEWKGLAVIKIDRE